MLSEIQRKCLYYWSPLREGGKRERTCYGRIMSYVAHLGSSELTRFHVYEWARSHAQLVGEGTMRACNTGFAEVAPFVVAIWLVCLVDDEGGM